MAGRLLLRIRLRFHDHAPQKLAIGLAFHQQATDELGSDALSGTGKERQGEVTEECGGQGNCLNTPLSTGVLEEKGLIRLSPQDTRASSKRCIQPLEQ